MNKHTNVHCWFMLVWLHKIRYIDITFNNVFENVEVNIIHQKMKIHHLLTLKLFQTCMGKEKMIF